MEVRFYDKIEDEKLDFAVIVSRYQGKWVYCKHKKRDTFEVPGGHREKGETVIECAKRELYEETGAIEFDLKQVGVYSVVREETESFGMLFVAEIKVLGELPPMEIGEVKLFDTMPTQLTYPLIQPKLVDRVKEYLDEKFEYDGTRFTYN